MATFDVDSDFFSAKGAVVNWRTVAQNLGIQGINLENLPTTLQLRWMIDPEKGMPTEPFKVWTRPYSVDIEKQLTIERTVWEFLSGHTCVTWKKHGSMCHVTVEVQAPPEGGQVAVWARNAQINNVSLVVRLDPGTYTKPLAAPVIDGLLVSPGVTVKAVRGITPVALAQANGWTLIETVGIPVEQAEWSGIGKHGEAQGLTGMFTDAPNAATHRLRRGAPPFGWSPLLANGVPAPLWAAPDFAMLVNEVNDDLLHYVHDIMASFPPNQQASQMVLVKVPPPQNSSGDPMALEDSEAEVPALVITLQAACSDPFLNLALGFGTAYVVEPYFGVLELPNFDYMVTAHWEKGFSGNSINVDYAAIVPTPGPAVPPPPPANMAVEFLGVLAPLAGDGNWRRSSRIIWDRPPHLEVVHPASCAAVRAGLSPAAATVALMEHRPSGGFSAIAINEPVEDDPDRGHLQAVDRELPIPANPGTCQVKYGAAVQDIYGQWTPWTTVNESMTQPDLERVRLFSAKLTATPPANGSVCPATLELEFFWNWRVRSPKLIRFAGRLYAAAEHGSPPPDLPVPGGLDRSLSGGGAFLELTFAGDTPSAPSATIVGLNEGGDQVVPFGAAQGEEARRYRVTLTGLSLDFGSTGHIGMALWVQGQELIQPQRTSDWSEKPLVISTSDPRPPVVAVYHVKFASLPDAAGESHAGISWAEKPESVGYFIYESDETQILMASGKNEPGPDQTLDDRLKAIQEAFNADPLTLRRQFTRLNAKPLEGIGTDVTLPRGSTVIHVYVVLGISAGQVESDWPSEAKKSLIAVAAPHIMKPAPPLLEVKSYLDQKSQPPVYKADLQIQTRPGPRVKRIDLHRVRVDDAAKELDTMGPPIARIKSSGSGWKVTEAVDKNLVSHIDTVSGTDAPPGSWRRVWYRAAAWTERDDTRGGLPGRSLASTAAWVVIPPPEPPMISPLSLGTGPTPADILVEWASASPLKKTPLGPHMMSVRARVAGAPAGTKPLISVDLPLGGLAKSAPGSGSGVWIFDRAPGLVTYRALIRRAAVTDAVKFAVRITDPLGRSGEGLTLIASGSVDPAPDITDMTLQKIGTPPHLTLVLKFASKVPLKASLNGPYKIQVTAVRLSPISRPVKPLKVEMPAGSVPTIPPAGQVPLGLYRLPGAGSKNIYTAVTTAKVVKFTVRITAPDGSKVEKSKIVT